MTQNGPLQSARTRQQQHTDTRWRTLGPRLSLSKRTRSDVSVLALSAYGTQCKLERPVGRLACGSPGLGGTPSFTPTGVVGSPRCLLPVLWAEKCKGFRCSCAWWQSCSLQNRFRPLSRRLHPRHRRSHRLPSTLLVPLTRPLHLNRHHRPRLHPRLHPNHHHALLRRPNHRP